MDKITIKDLPAFNTELEEDNSNELDNEASNIFKEDKNKKTTIFNRFFKLFSFLKINLKLLEKKVIVVQKTPEQIELENEVKKLLDRNEFLYIDKLITNGYKLTASQKGVYIDKLTKLIEKENLHKLNLLLNSGFNMPDELMANLFMNTTFQIYNWEYLKQSQEKDLFSEDELKEKYFNNYSKINNHKYMYDYDYSNSSGEYSVAIVQLEKYLKNINNQAKILSVLLDNMSEYINKDNYLSVQWNLLKTYEYFNNFLIPHLNEDKKNKIGEILLMLEDKLLLTGKYHDEIIDVKRYLNELNIPATNSVKKIEELIKKTRSLYLNEKQIFIKEEIILIEDIKDKEKLPQESQEKVNEIISLYNIFLENKKLIPNNDFINADRFIKERMPEMISDYISLDPKYRNKMKKEDGNTPLSLLNDSLSNIIIYLESINEDINYKKFSNLNATNIYTNNFKNK